MALMQSQRDVTSGGAGLGAYTGQAPARLPGGAGPGGRTRRASGTGTVGGEQRVPRRARRIRAPALGPVARRRTGQEHLGSSGVIFIQSSSPGPTRPHPFVRRVRRRRASATGRGGLRRPRRRDSPRSGGLMGWSTRAEAISHRGGLCRRARRCPPREWPKRSRGWLRHRGLPVCFKATFNKANRARVVKHGGPGLDEGLLKGCGP